MTDVIQTTTPERSACGQRERGGAPRVVKNVARASARGGGAPRVKKKW